MSETVIVKLKISAEDAAKYEAIAGKFKISLEAAMAAQLTRFASVDSENPIVLQDSERQELAKLAKRTIVKGADVVKIVRDAVTLECEGTKFAIAPSMLARLKRLAPKRMTFHEFLGDHVSRVLANGGEY